MQGKIGEWFHTSVRIHQGCLLSSTLLNVFLEQIMTDALEDHTSTVNIGGPTITNFRFAYDIDGLAGEKEELINLVNRLDKTSARYGMEISTEKTKIMTNNSNTIRSRITANGQELEKVKQFKYLGANISDEGSKTENHARSAQTSTALAKLKPIWRDKNIALKSKMKLVHALVLSIFLYACESWTLTAELQRKITAVEMRCFRIILGISCTDHVTNEEIRKNIAQHVGHCEDLLTAVKKKLRWLGM